LKISGQDGRVDNQLCRESGFQNQLPAFCHITDVKVPVAVTGKNHRAALAFTFRQKSYGIAPAVFPVAVRKQGYVVDFRDNPVFQGCAYQLRIIHGKTAVITVTDDFYPGMGHGFLVSEGIFPDGAGGINYSVLC